MVFDFFRDALGERVAVTDGWLSHSVHQHFRAGDARHGAVEAAEHAVVEVLLVDGTGQPVRHFHTGSLISAVTDFFRFSVPRALIRGSGPMICRNPLRFLKRNSRSMSPPTPGEPELLVEPHGSEVSAVFRKETTASPREQMPHQPLPCRSGRGGNARRVTVRGRRALRFPVLTGRTARTHAFRPCARERPTRCASVLGKLLDVLVDARKPC